MPLIPTYAGQPLTAVITVQGGKVPVTASALNLLSDSGTTLLSMNKLTSLGGNSYMGKFIAPSEAFVLQPVGTDDDGYRFSYISDILVKTSAIELTLSTYTVTYYDSQYYTDFA